MKTFKAKTSDGFADFEQVGSFVWYPNGSGVGFRMVILRDHFGHLNVTHRISTLKVTDITPTMIGICAYDIKQSALFALNKLIERVGIDRVTTKLSAAEKEAA